MILRQLTPESIVANIRVKNATECAEVCLNDYEGCLAFDLWYNNEFEDYDCRLAADTFETVETEYLEDLLHFEMEKFPCEYV